MINNCIASVIIPCYNAEKTILDSLDSINIQDVNLQIIIINDGSTDSTLEIIKNYKFDQKHQVEIINRCNKGFLYSLYEGITLSKCSYIARIDADDVWCENHINLLLNEFYSHKNLVLVGTAAYIINDNNHIIDSYVPPKRHREIIKYLHKDNPFVHSSIMFKKESYDKTCGYLIGNNEESKHIADYNLWFELSKIGECKNIENKNIYYRVSKHSMSRTINKITNYKARYKTMKKVSLYYNSYYLYSILHLSIVYLKIIYFSLKQKIYE